MPLNTIALLRARPMPLGTLSSTSPMSSRKQSARPFTKQGSSLLFLLREFEILLKGDFADVEHRYFALRRGDGGVEVCQASEVEDVDPLILLDQELKQSDRFVEEFMP